jgi:hypothetical protein
MFSILLCAIAIAAPSAFAAKANPTVQVGGLIFAHYGYDLTEGADGFNEFALDRAYLTATATIDEHFGARLTLDADRFKPVSLSDGSSLSVDTKYRVFVKHAYLEWRDEKTSIKGRFGVVDTPYCPFYDSFVGIRYIMESFPKQNKVLDTADLGFSFQGTEAKGLFNWTAAVLNGEGYGKPEVDAGKAGQVRLTLDPLAPGGDMNLPVTVFVSYSGHPTTDTPVFTGIGAVGFKQTNVVAWAEALLVSSDTTSSMGYSATLLPRLPKVAGLVFRYDHFDPDTDATDDATNTLVAGVTHDFLPKISVAATYEQVTAEAAPDTPSRGAFVHMQAGF